MEGDGLDIYFQLNINMTTPGVMTAGNITAMAGGTASEFIYVCKDALIIIDALQMILILLHLTHYGSSILRMFISSLVMII